MDPFVPARPKVATGVSPLDEVTESRIDRQEVLERPVLLARLADDESSAVFLDPGLYLTRVTVDEVVAATGFALVVPDDVSDTRDPTPEELDLLRTVLDPRGVKTGDDERDADLQGGDWFETSRFPTWTYTGTGVVPEGPGRFSIAGALRVHGVAQPVALEVNVVRGLPNPLYHAVGHASRHGFAMTVTRTDALVGDDVTIELDVSLAP